MIDTTTLSMTMPPTLTALPRWLLWKAVPGKRADGTTKTDKVPLACDGTAGSITDPAKWTTYEQAVAAAVQDDVCVGSRARARFIVQAPRGRPGEVRH